jgi:hypothetical protein
MSTSPFSPLSLAIETHRAAKAAWYAQSEAARNSAIDPLFDKLSAAEDDLAATPTVNAAELVEKLRYLFGDAVEGAKDVDCGDIGSVFAALSFHFADSAVA